MRTSTSGSRLRISTTIQISAMTAAAANRPSTRADVQPQERPSLIGRSNATSQPASSSAPSQSTFPRVRIGDSGTTRKTPIAATVTTPNGNQKSQW